ncbi:hypothetical protein [Nocardioides sp. LHG3406-4]|uniref:hypothetical protein n=1 Tax=Nocardioides sp. LHG3406-4 TaxID=2804575 RepID=UPI003CE77A15
MLRDPEVQELARTYGPMLDALQQALDAEFGPLSWAPRSDPAAATRHDGSSALRVGAINAIGVPTSQLDPPAITRAVNQVLARWDFPEQPEMTGSPSGELICEAVDDRGAEFTLLIKMAVDAWVDQPL